MSDHGKWPWFIDWLIAGFVALLLISFGALGTREAGAHEAPAGWSYPLSCCSNFDCREVPAGAVKERPQGFVIPGTGEVLPMTDKRIRNSPDGKFHWCAHQSGVDAGKTICLFVPPRGF
ncbi:MAG: hypothetical protein ABIF45_17490 [Pseudomonadota bacterium]